MIDITEDLKDDFKRKVFENQLIRLHTQIIDLKIFPANNRTFNTISFTIKTPKLTLHESLLTIEWDTIELDFISDVNQRLLEFSNFLHQEEFDVTFLEGQFENRYLYESNDIMLLEPKITENIVEGIVFNSTSRLDCVKTISNRKMVF